MAETAWPNDPRTDGAAAWASTAPVPPRRKAALAAPLPTQTSSRPSPSLSPTGARAKASWPGAGDGKAIDRISVRSLPEYRCSWFVARSPMRWSTTPSPSWSPMAAAAAPKASPSVGVGVGEAAHDPAVGAREDVHPHRP